jgi:hypothetical protein
LSRPRSTALGPKIVREIFRRLDHPTAAPLPPTNDLPHSTLFIPFAPTYMPRANVNASTLRNRNRVTNKTRLKVYRGSIDADPLLLEEEDVANVLKLNTQGVDAEDANVSPLCLLIVFSSLPHLKPSALVVLTWQLRHAFRGLLTKLPFLVYRNIIFKPCCPPPHNDTRVTRNGKREVG